MSYDLRKTLLWSLTALSFMSLLYFLLGICALASTFAASTSVETDTAFFAGGPLALLGLVLGMREPRLKRVVVINAILLSIFAAIWIFVLAAWVTTEK